MCSNVRVEALDDGKEYLSQAVSNHPKSFCATHTSIRDAKVMEVLRLDRVHCDGLILWG
jgi:hypothetical protein